MGGVYVNGNRQTLVESIKQGGIEGWVPGEDGKPVKPGFFAIQCPNCSMRKVFMKPSDIPAANIPCKCEGGMLLEYVDGPH